MNLYIGLMSGTSMDGIDAALVDLPGNQLITGLTRPYSNKLKSKLQTVLDNQSVSMEELCQINTLIGREFAEATIQLLEKSNHKPQDIIAIGSHGQTVSHNTKAEIPYTLQLGCAHTIAELTGIPVVADFRTRDLVLGGQGAPFAPLYHKELFGKIGKRTGLVNIGGLSNITILSPNGEVKGWDVGPGNCLLDAWCQDQRHEPYDKDGDWASSGHVLPALLANLLADPFFQITPPKSIGKEYFSINWALPENSHTYKPEDIQATFVELTVRSIQMAVDNLSVLYLCGGGAHNKALYKRLVDLLPEVKIKTTQEESISPDFLEAMMFAWLAYKNVKRESVDLTKITGSSKPLILGTYYPYCSELHSL